MIIPLLQMKNNLLSAKADYSTRPKLLNSGMMFNTMPQSKRCDWVNTQSRFVSTKMLFIVYQDHKDSGRDLSQNLQSLYQR